MCPVPSDESWHHCLVCEAPAIDHAHVESRARNPARKKDKSNIVPLCRLHHDEVDLRQNGTHGHAIRRIPGRGRLYFRYDLHGNTTFQKVLGPNSEAEATDGSSLELQDASASELAAGDGPERFHSEATGGTPSLAVPMNAEGPPKLGSAIFTGRGGEGEASPTLPRAEGDAQGATISEDPATAIVEFSFESFAASADTVFKITNGLDSVNDAHVINVASSSDDTDNVSILSFNVEIEGTADVTLDALPVLVSVGGTASNIYTFLSGLSLWMDGEEVGTVNLATDCLDLVLPDVCTDESSSYTYLFDDLALDLNGGSDYDFLVKADIKSTSDAGVADGDTILAALTETETDNAACLYNVYNLIFR